jgi:dTDP-4-dehydrorhamnose 3,5-epimerase
MPVERTAIAGLLVVRWPEHADERGMFRQVAQRAELREALGRDVELVQLNHARSVPGTLRGFHAEPWDKLIHVVRGTVFAAVADIRPDSQTFGEVVTFLIGDPPGEPIALFLADGLANAYTVHGDAEVDYVYAVSQQWRPVDKRAIAWDDPDLGVAWPVARPILSDADRANPRLRERFADHPRFASDPESPVGP